jgi:two-component system, probable response regulator PhcQ
VFLIQPVLSAHFEERAMTKILLVDDERNVLSSLRRTIHAMPADTFEGPVSVETFEKPELALLRAAECEFDLVISDWRMPGMNGIAFLNELIQIQPTIARLVLSGYGDFLSELKAIQRIKVFHFINKPWDNNELASLLRLALEHRRLMLANAGPSDKELRRETRLTQLELQRIDKEEPAILKMKRESLDPFQLCG